MNSLELDNNNANNNVLVLRPATRTLISSLLNPIKLLRNERGLPRDWQGLAELCGVAGELIPSISNEHNPTATILKTWQEQIKSEATVDKLITYLEQIDRSDVVDDILPLIAEDLKYHKEHLPNGKTVKPFDFESDKSVLTRDDVNRINEGLDPQLYDAFVLFDEDDIDFATELIDNMEKNYDLKFCVKERDLVAGGSEHDAIIRLIAERCGRLIVILSQAFLQSNANKFFYSLAQSISIDQRARKIIPCLYKDCGRLPPELDCYFKLDIRKSGTFWNFWDKLRDSIKVPEKLPRPKLSLPNNDLFRGIEASEKRNSVSRSVSNTDQQPNLKSTLHKDSISPRSISQSVKFNSMNDLQNAKMSVDNIVPSTSANNLEKCEDKAVRKRFSFFKKFKNFVPTSKSDKNRLPTEQQLQIDIAAGIKNDNNFDENVSDQTPNNKKGNKCEEKREKKKKFTLKLNKKKAVLEET
ncbi:unnamed protein product [Ceutorhynchus assimilis]|uniref:Myeloid differentiation primary response protein MyD88 n=1 Tax=Ceutorhynchus assimilis TaxID=467358 RepID=A0A9N9MHT2_9CUCU|nr:unnamed protein product [Ceutorhynchus assimilis]